MEGKQPKRRPSLHLQSLGLAMSHPLTYFPPQLFFSPGVLKKPKRGERRLGSCSNKVIVCKGSCCLLDVIFFGGYLKNFFHLQTIWFLSDLLAIGLQEKKVTEQTQHTVPDRNGRAVM